MDFSDRYRRRDLRLPRQGETSAIERFLAPAEKPQLIYSITSGVKAGFVGGLVMAAILSWSYVSIGGSAALPASTLVYSLTHNAAFAESASGIAFGLIMHMITAMGAGGIFGFIMAEFIGKMNVAGAMAVGGIYGLLVWILGQYVVLNLTSSFTLQLFNQSTLALSHLVYGLCLGLFGSAYHLSRHTRHHR